jgi:hypothetical protein
MDMYCRFKLFYNEIQFFTELRTFRHRGQGSSRHSNYVGTAGPSRPGTTIFNNNDLIFHLIL